MEYIRNKRFGEERALYGLRGAVIERCRVEGEEDGESFLKESADIAVRECYFDLRYPMWHVGRLLAENCIMTKNCRAALWYDRDVTLKNCKMDGIKALRECKKVLLENIEANSPEFGWRCSDVTVRGGRILSEYAFLGSRRLTVDGLDFEGKCSFQYVNGAEISHAKLSTKDAFWHSKNVTVRDCDIDGEYLGWYSDGLTLVNCRIRGTQPLCYCKRLTLIGCTMEECDLAFEYSDLNADVKGEILSVKNPKSGRIVADGYGEIILSGSKYRCSAKIQTRSTQTGAESE